MIPLFFALILTVMPGVERFFTEERIASLEGKGVGLITNHTGVDRSMRPTVDLFFDHADKIRLLAFFSPEHGLFGQHYAADAVADAKFKEIPVYSLHGKTRRPTAEMLAGIDVLVYDMQCIGVRAYTYATTLFYAMEEAAKAKIKVIVLDRPNPLGGLLVDGPMLDEKFRSFIGYINVPYCHGMTIGELARFFNEEYKVGCDLEVIPMKGWKRSMSFRETHLPWIPPSPNIPEPDTPFYSSSTGILGELHLLNIGVGYTLPFKIVGAPWIRATELAAALNKQKLPGVHFHPFHFRPFFGLYKGSDCEGVLIRITQPKIYRPLSVQYLILGVLKSLYPNEVMKRIQEGSKDLFNKANGTDAIYDILVKEKFPAWKLIQFDKAARDAFLEIRQKYLLPEYGT